ncbi:hypothetical protein JXI42_04875 [bacterium]|nr:hypothetical protein [bacterium]
MNKNEHKYKYSKRRIWQSIFGALESFGRAFPIASGVVLLLELFESFVIKKIIRYIFPDSLIQDISIDSLIEGKPIDLLEPYYA